MLEFYKETPLTFYQQCLSYLGLYNQHQQNGYPRIYIKSYQLLNTYFILNYNHKYFDYAVFEKYKDNMSKNFYHYDEYKNNKKLYQGKMYGIINNKFDLSIINLIDQLELMEFYFKVKLLNEYLIQDIIYYIYKLK